MQRKDVDVVSAKTKATATIASLSLCRQDEPFDSVRLLAQQRAKITTIKSFGKYGRPYTD